jgi:heavy metal translocating P-type ATPase
LIISSLENSSFAHPNLENASLGREFLHSKDVINDVARKPCKKHLRAARERYASTLEAIGCICRALIARNLEACCSSTRPSSEKRASGCTGPVGKGSCSRPQSITSPVSSMQACSSGLGRSTETVLRGRGSISSRQTTNLGGCSEKACCNSSQTTKAPECSGKTSCDSSQSKKVTDCSENECCCSRQTREPKTCTGEACCGGSQILKPENCSEKDCCASLQPSGERKQSDVSPLHNPSSSDVEKGNTGLEHITLVVQGLTCVGCETKLFRSLVSISSVRNPQTSLVLSQADFDLDMNVATVSDVIHSIERTTGFGCQRINTKGQNLDIVIDRDAKDFINQDYPAGVDDMVIVDKHIVRITYDAKLIGARELLENTFDASVRLAPLRPSHDLMSGKRHVRNTAYITLLSALLTIPVLILAWAPLPPHPIPYGAVSLALATIVQFVVAGPFYSSALRSLIFTRVIELDLLIVLSTSTAYIFSVVSYAYQVEGRPLPTGSFFETSTLLVTLIMVGRLVSAFARHKAVESISIRSLQPTTALLADSDGQNKREIDTRLLQYGDTFKVTPDSRIATDGNVISGITEVDESMVTGEAQPVNKSPGSSVIAGSLNGSGAIIVQLTHLPGNNTISEIAAMVDEAKFSKPKLQELADRVAGYFVPVVVALTLVTFIIWIAVGRLVRHQASAVVPAITYAISVLIVSCPCAIGLAVPMVVVISGGVAAKRGVIFKSAETIEIARKVSHVVFDKTGTLTQGQLSVAAEEYLSDSDSREYASSVALGLTANSKHPVSAAVGAHLKALGVKPAFIQNVTSLTGSGMEGTYDGAAVRAGNSRWLSAERSPAVQSFLSKGLTVFCVSRDGDILAVFGLADTLRPDAHSTVSELKSRGIAVSLVSGDDNGPVEAIAAKLEIPSTHVRSRCSPADKQKYIKTVMGGDGGEKRIVLFCGDGTNDAVALAEASIGLHMNEGTDVAQSAADAVLVRPFLSGILILLDLSRAASRRIFFNFAWSFVYNVFAILLAAGAFVNARIPPQYAGLGELVSVLPVILVALQLRWAKVG